MFFDVLSSSEDYCCTNSCEEDCEQNHDTDVTRFTRYDLRRLRSDWFVTAAVLRLCRTLFEDDSKRTVRFGF